MAKVNCNVIFRKQIMFKGRCVVFNGERSVFNAERVQKLTAFLIFQIMCHFNIFHHRDTEIQ